MSGGPEHLDERSRPAEPLRFAGTPTPIAPLRGLARELGLEADRLWIKRDDLTAIAAGGNKARKLEFLAADALRRGATVLVTGGAAQSNHVRTTAAVAAMVGMRAIGVVAGRRGPVPEGNLLLDEIFGIELVDAAERYGSSDLDDAIDRECQRLADEGEVPYSVPLGGSSPVGIQGYVEAAEEIDNAVSGSTVYVAVGTGGTHAGLAVGRGGHDSIRGVDVGARPGVTSVISSLAEQAADLVGKPPPTGSPIVDSSQVGERYGTSTREGRDAIRRVARTDGVVLDPVYTSKAMAALIADARAGALPDGPIVFIHTGGLPGLLVERHARSLSEHMAQVPEG